MNSITIKIPTAEEAHLTIETGQYKKAQDQAATIETLILKAIAEGRYDIYFPGNLETAVRNELQEKGYKCKIGQEHNDSYVLISW